MLQYIYCAGIEHINCIFGLVGTPSDELLGKMTSKDVYDIYIQFNLPFSKLDLTLFKGPNLYKTIAEN